MKPPENQSILAHDADWQYPAITEQHAYKMVKTHLSYAPGVYYLGFPWATLIDLLNTGKPKAEKLLKSLKLIVAQIPNESKVVTVCQHIHLMKFQDLFFDNKITDIYWTHTTKQKDHIYRDRRISLYPFPLFPVQFKTRNENNFIEKRKYLFSFIGARANKWYLTESRNWILDFLSNDKRGLVLGRDQWHYNKVVYDLQIHNLKKSKKNTIDNEASEKFKAVLRDTTFALCPSGSGPNSIRLWESISAGSIPVILADTHKLPGNFALWKEAAVFCDEKPEAIKALPDKLAKIAKDKNFLDHKREQLGQLWMLYGTNSFIYDIQNHFLSYSNLGTPMTKKCDSTSENYRLRRLAQKIDQKKSKLESDYSLFLNSCISQMFINKSLFANDYSESTHVRSLLLEALGGKADQNTIESYKRNRVLLNFNEQNIEPKFSTDKIDSKLKVYLSGKHSNRTPLSYNAYVPHFKDYVNMVDAAEFADVVVTGFNIDFQENPSEIRKNKIENYKLKHAVVSEEPLWDVVWSKGYQKKYRIVSDKGGDIPYCFLNHMNSPIYNFDKIPYFLTTKDSFFIRYGNLLRARATQSVDELLAHWENLNIRTAFYAEKRDDKRYAFKSDMDDIYGLSTFRTDVAKSVKVGKSLCVGSGWSKTIKKRQALPDWHLDKLNSLSDKVFIVSGLENTHCNNYITEKIFDAFAANSVPVYFAGPKHRIHNIFPDGGFINLFGKTAKEGGKIIDEFKPTREFAQAYLKSQIRMLDLFSDANNLIQERRRVASHVVDELCDYIKNP